MQPGSDSGTGTVVLADMGSNVLEFSAVSRITGDPKYRQKAEKGLRAVHAANKNVRWLVAAGMIGQAGQKGSCKAAAMAMPGSLEVGHACTVHLLATFPRPLKTAPHLPPHPIHPLTPACPLFPLIYTLKAILYEKVDRETGMETGFTRGVGAGTDSYYEYLIK